MRQLEIERNAMSLYVRIHILLVYFENKNYFRLAKETNELLTKEFYKDKYEYISKQWKSDFDKIIRYKMFYDLEIELEFDKENKKDIEDSIEALKKLQKEILRLREV